jgi:hypothetical protein
MDIGLVEVSLVGEHVHDVGLGDRGYLIVA